MNRLSNDTKQIIDDIKNNCCEDRVFFHDDMSYEEGTKALAEALKVNTSLKVLGLYGSGICNKGVSALAEVLRVNTTLKELDLCLNNICDEGAKAMVEVLKNKNNLLIHI